jgi:RNA polymerase sigma-70 factor (ECF subfamily)
MKMMGFPTDQSLVGALVGGRPEGFDALYERMGGRLLRTARTMLRDAGEAEDAVQDVFVALARYRHRLGRVEDLEAYVFAMLRHGVGRRLRRKRNEERHLRRLTPVGTAGPETGLADDLAAALAGLPAEQREVIALKIDGGLTFAQIGAVLNLSPNTAASRYRYALEKLRRMLE